MMKLKELFELLVGYQDHSDAENETSFWLPAAAVGMGVDILEKHVTHDRSFRGVDHEAALNPDEFTRFVNMVRTIEAGKGVSIPKPFTTEELKYRHYVKKSIVAGSDLPIGKCLEPEDLEVMFAENMGIPPDQAHKLIGKVTLKDIPVYHLFAEEDVS